MSFSVAVAGASGYAGGELLRLLAGHPEFVLRTVTAQSSAGLRLGEVHPHLRTNQELVLQPTNPETLAGHDLVFLALPHGASGVLAAGLDERMLVVDCAADHRIQQREDWARFYGGDFFEPWPYGLPELVRHGDLSSRSLLRAAKRIAVPGCNVTAVTLGIAPGLHAGVVSSRDVVSVLAVGTSGAGKTLRSDLLASEMFGSAHAYAVGGIHRHVPEIVQNLSIAAGQPATVSFTPVLVPLARGILATTTAILSPTVHPSEVRDAWQSAYASEPFVHLLPEGHFPSVSSVVGSNVALMGIAVDEEANRVVTVTAIDNLVKGTAGAAIQAANIALGLEETTGLPLNGVAP